jgi:hypothetical protein
MPQLEGRPVFLVDPKSPGRLAGHVVPPPDSTGADSLSFGVFGARREAGIDSLVMPWPPVRLDRAVRVDRKGEWLLSPLEPGRYRLAAWLDLNRNDRFDPTSPWGRGSNGTWPRIRKPRDWNWPARRAPEKGSGDVRGCVGGGGHSVQERGGG